ncbi:hypothetical protein ACLOJK_026646 [Asimina triloba]
MACHLHPPAWNFLCEPAHGGLHVNGGQRRKLIMLAYNPRGKERTEEEFKELAKGAGFGGIGKACTAYSMWVLEFYKKI